MKKADFDFSKPLKFVGMAPGRVAASKETCEAIAEYLKRIGVQIDLQILEFGAWNQIKQAKMKDPTVAMIYATGPDPSKDVAYKLLVNTRSTLATSWVFDKENDEMLSELNNFTNMKERDAFINKILRRMHDEAFFMPLWANDTLYVTSKKVNLKVAPYLAFAPLDDVTTSRLSVSQWPRARTGGVAETSAGFGLGAALDLLEIVTGDTMPPLGGSQGRHLATHFSVA